MEKLTKENRGITLVALVVTIIVLLILATVSISIFFVDNGLFSRAFQSKKWHEIGEIQERLEIEKEPVFIDNKGKITIEEYLEHIIDEGIIKEEDIENTENEDAKYITVEDKYIYLVEAEEDGNIKITYQGEVKNFKPGLEIEITKVTTNSITVKANGRRMNNGEYEYYIKDIETGEEYKLKKTQKEDEYTFEGLTQNKEYQIKVVAKNSNGEAIKESGIIRTIELESLQTANITFTYNPEGWTKENVVVTANVSQNIQEGARVQTSKDGKEWIDEISQTFEVNGNMYVRIYDGTNESNYGVAEVTKIDKEKPIAGGVATTNSIQITGTDEASGIIGYQITTTNSEPTSFTAVTNTKSLSKSITGLKQSTTYYIWIKDEAGNISEGKGIQTGSIGNLTTSNTTFSYSPSGWTNGSVKVTASTTVTIPSGYKLQTSKDAKTWTDGGVQTFTANGSVYARLYDGINETGHAVGQVTKIDKTKPVVTTATPTQTTIAIKATDEASGIIGYTVTTSTSTPSSFTAVTNTKSLSVTKSGLSSGTAYYVWVKDAAGNVSAYKAATTTKYTVTYYINNTTKTQQYKTGEGILSPSFTPSISGWTFIGWRTDKTASSSVLSGTKMGSANITLYAVFRQTITLSYNANGGSSTPAAQTGYRYYNNGNVANPSFTLAAAIARSGYNFQYWRLNGTSGTAYNARGSITLSSSATMYATWTASTSVATISGYSAYFSPERRIVLHRSYDETTNNGPVRSTVSGSVISWVGTGAEVKANTKCTVNIYSTDMSCCNLDAAAGMYVAIYKNDSEYSKIVNRWHQSITSFDFSINTNISLSAGERCSIVVNSPDNSNKYRNAYSGTIKFTATAN